ncbi:MAG: 2OG-Fe(II) oxygenase [Thalassotalea sp.]
MKTTFTQEWKDWITLNVKNGQNKDGLFKILLDDGFDFLAIAKEMKYLPSVPVEHLVNPFDAERRKQTQSSQQLGQKTQHIKIDLNKIFIPNAIKSQAKKLELYTLDNFLNKKECDHLLASLTAKACRTKTPSSQDNQPIISSFESNADDLIADVDNRICRLIGIDPSYSEVLQCQCYQVGQASDVNVDYFEPEELKQNSLALAKDKMGQRTFTVMIFLNDISEGGETVFVNAGEEFKPKQGQAIIWNNLLPDGSENIASAYLIKPTLFDNKAVIIKRFRERSRLPAAPKKWIKEENEYVPNYTTTGFIKSKLPEPLFNQISNFYQANKVNKIDEHVAGDFIVSNNKRQQTTFLVELQDALKQEIHDALKPAVTDWCGKVLESSYVYGIRIYTDKAQLKCHRDRVETHILGVIINVDQEVNEDWPLVIEDNYYRQHKILLKPGEVIFYESARLTHGRPIALNGKSFANIFCHFVPSDYVPKYL